MNRIVSNEERYDALLAWFRDFGSVIVAYSGGIDSAFVLLAATEALGREHVLGVTAISAAVPDRERRIAAEIAEEIGAAHRFVDSHELERPGYVENAGDRCYHCKTELYHILDSARNTWHGREPLVVVNGANADDAGDHRPGMIAATEAAVRSPLLELGLTKAQVREFARGRGLRIWDKPASPCLASRIPYGMEVNVTKLSQIERAENVLFALGFQEFRVRHHDQTARIEVREEDLQRLVESETRAKIVAEFRRLGFLHVALDLGGFVSGNLNRALDEHERGLRDR